MREVSAQVFVLLSVPRNRERREISLNRSLSWLVCRYMKKGEHVICTAV